MKLLAESFHSLVQPRLLWLSILLASQAFAQADLPAILNVEKLGNLKPLMDGWIEDQTLPNAAVLVLHQDEVVFEYQVGLLDVELGTPVKRDSLYRIYSMTKPVTSVAVMMLVEQGKLALDEPISVVLSEFENLSVITEAGNQEPAVPITLRHLLTHTAGLSYGYYGNTVVDRLYREYPLIDDWDYLVPTTHDLVVGLGTMPLLFQPGTRFHYSFASDVLAEVVVRAGEMRFDEYLEKHLWGPLGVSDAYFDVPDSVLDRFGTNHYPVGADGEFPVQDTPREDPEFRNVSFLSGGGGLVMSVDDFGKFALMLLNHGTLNGNQILRPETLKLMFTNQLPQASMPFKFGLGFRIEDVESYTNLSETSQAFSWGGAAGTSFWVNPTYDVGLVFMTQLISAPNEPQQAIKDTIYSAFGE